MQAVPIDVVEERMRFDLFGVVRIDEMAPAVAILGLGWYDSASAGMFGPLVIGIEVCFGAKTVFLFLQDAYDEVFCGV